MDSNHSNTSKALKGMSSQAVVTLLLGVTEVVSFSIMSRLLSKEDFGFYAAINAIVVIFASLSETGIGSALVQKKEISLRYIGNAFTLSLLFGIASMFILFVAAIIVPDSVVDKRMKLPLMLLSVTLLLNCVASIFKSILHRQMKFMTIGVIQLVSIVITTVVAIILAVKGYGYYAIITKAILASIISCFLFFLFSKTRCYLIIDKETFKAIFGFSGWLMASRFFSDLAKQVDKLIMPKLMPIAELGAYTRPKDFVNTFSGKINGIFDNALFPILSSLQDNKVALTNAYRRSLYSMNLFALLLSIAFGYNAELLLRVFFGEEWLYLTPVFIVFSFLVFFNADGRIADCYLRSLGKTKQQFYFRIAEFLTKMIGVVIGSFWGLLGVAIGVTSMECIMKFIKVIYAGYLIDFSYKRVVWILLMSCQFAVVLLPICLITYLITPHTIIGEFVNLCVFALSSLTLFVLCPNVIGNNYKNDLYPTVKKYVLSLLKVKCS